MTKINWVCNRVMFYCLIEVNLICKPRHTTGADIPLVLALVGSVS